MLPKQLRHRAFEIAHEDGHQGIVKTKQRLRDIFWWPSMDKFTENAIRECNLCANHDKTAKFTAAPISTTPWPETPWSRLAIDIRGSDSSLGVRCRFAIVVIDYFSKWAEVEFAPDVKGSRVVEMLHRLFHREGIPKEILSDNGSQFVSREYRSLLTAYGIKDLKTPLYRPEANGLVERFNRTLGDFCATAKARGGEFASQMTEMLGAYIATPQTTTGCSPAELLHGRPMRTRLHVQNQPTPPKTTIELEETRQRVVERRQKAQKEYADHRRAAKTENKLSVGGQARIKEPSSLKGQPKCSEPMTITGQAGKHSFRLEDGKLWHQDRLSPMTSTPVAEREGGEEQPEQLPTTSSTPTKQVEPEEKQQAETSSNASEKSGVFMDAEDVVSRELLKRNREIDTDDSLGSGGDHKRILVGSDYESSIEGGRCSIERSAT